MPTRTPQTFLVLDACVLIDYVDADAGSLSQIAKGVGAISVLRTVLNEVEQLTEQEALALGIKVVDAGFDEVWAAGESQGRGLSFPDRLCLEVAARRGWTCVTNDGGLRRACADRGVAVSWGLAMMLEAVRGVALSAVRAQLIAWQIHENNPHYVTSDIVQLFVAKLGK